MHALEKLSNYTHRKICRGVAGAAAVQKLFRITCAMSYTHRLFLNELCNEKLSDGCYEVFMEQFQLQAVLQK
eukprot:2647912-Amphidinium_carterae.2